VCRPSEMVSGLGWVHSLLRSPRADRSITAEVPLKILGRFGACRSGRFALVTLALASCTAEAPQQTGAATQAVINAPLPSNLNLALNATTVTIGPFAQVFGDVGSAALDGLVVFDVGSSQGFGGNVLATSVAVRTAASVGHVFGNDITVDGSAAQQTLGLDPTALPAVPEATAATPGTTNVTVAANQSKQLCPGQYGVISLGVNSTLNLNGGVYQVTRLSLADGAKLEPSEPVVLLVSGNLTTGTGAIIGPFPELVNPMSAGDIRIEIGGSAMLGDSAQVRAHLLVPNGGITTGTGTSLSGVGWARTITIGPRSVVASEGVFSAQAPSVPPPCNDNNACTADQCIGSGTTVAFCRNTPAPSGTSCDDGNVCNGVATCDGAGVCQPGTTASAGTLCLDGDACNGNETCDGFGTCVPGAPPVVNDGNTCTADACDPATGVANVPLPDGTACSGNGVCQGGTCSIQETAFSADFFEGQQATTQCDSWNTFLGELTNSSYSSVTISGTFDPFGVTCSDPVAATQICQGMHNGGFVSVFCSGRIWNVGSCGGATELSADGNTCACDTGYIARPCIQRGFGNPNWGGANTSTCSGPSQTINVTCR